MATLLSKLTLSDQPASQEGHCKNCSTPLQENYCAVCGQPRKTERITFQRVLEEFVEQVINLDTGFLRTLRNMTFRPGHMIREYIEGKRQPYLKPLQFYLIMLALYFAVNEFLDIDPLEAGSKLSRKMQPAALNSQQQALQLQLIKMLGKYFKLMLSALMVTQALSLRLFYRRSGLYLAEMLVVAMFLAGYHYLFSLFTTLSLALLKEGTAYWILTAVSFGLVTVYSTWTIVQFFQQKGLKAVLKAGLSVTFATVLYGLLSTLVGIGMVIFILMKK